MAISKVIFNGTTLMDVTGNTVTSSTLVSPETATKADGTEITGSLVAKTQSDLSASGATVTVPAGVYSTQATKSVASGSASPASTISGTGATVSSSSTTITLSKTVSNTPSVSAGYVASGTSGNSSVSLSATDSNFTAENIRNNVVLFGKTGSYEGSGGNIQGSKSYTVSASGNQTISPDTGYDAMGEVVLTVPAQTLPTGTSTTATGTNLANISRATYTRYINIPTGYNGTASRYTINSVSNGSATPASTISGTDATASSSSTTITLTKSVTNTPTVSAGYISSGTSGSSSVSLSATDANFTEANIKKDVSIFGKTGTYEGTTGITRIINNDTSITPSGTYATSTYYNTSYGVKIGYMPSGDVLLSMRGGTSTSYEYLNFVLGTVPSGVTLTWALDTSANYATGKPGVQYACVLSGITQKSNISLTMSSRDGTYDYVTVTINVTVV